MRLEAFRGLVRRLAAEVPDGYLDGIAEVTVSPRAVPHPVHGDVYTLGQCIPFDTGGAEVVSRVVLYHGSFRALAADRPDFDWEVDQDAHPQSAQCPHQQRVDVECGRKSHRYLARFDATVCETCPLADQCPTQPLKQRPERVLRFSQQDLNCAMRRQRCVAVRAGPHNYRAAVEATVRAVKHPFRNGKVPVRGKPRVSMVLVGSAAMNNARQIHRYLVRKRADAAKKAKEYAQGSLLVSFLAALPPRLSAQFRYLHLPRPVWACQT